MAQYKRILLKLSGESLMGGKQYGIDEVRLNEYATRWGCWQRSSTVWP